MFGRDTLYMSPNTRLRHEARHWGITMINPVTFYQIHKDDIALTRHCNLYSPFPTYTYGNTSESIHGRRRQQTVLAQNISYIT